MNELPTKTIQEFIKENEITAEFISVPENPNMEPSKGMQPFHFHVLLKRKEHHLTTYYSVGIGIVERWTQQKKNQRSIWGFHGATPKATGKRNVLDAEMFDAIAPKYRPEVADILDCLASDASCVHYGQSFEDFAGDMGYEKDSRKAKATYNLIKKQAEALKQLLGNDAFEKLLKIERL